MYFDCLKTKIQNFRNRRYMRTFLKLSCMLFFPAVLLSGCKKQHTENTASEYTGIVVGIDKFEPYTYLDLDGNVTGVDIDLATMIFHRLGYEPEFKIIPWNDKNTLLENGSIDCIWSCYSMNGRENDYQWAGPYLYSRQVIAVRADSSIWNFDDLAGKKVGVQATTRAAGLFLHTTDSPLPEAGQVNCFSMTEDMFASIRKGYVDAIAGHEAVINEFIKNTDGTFRLLEESPHVSRAGIAFQKGMHAELTQKMNALLREMTADGTIGTIVEKYGLDAEKVVVKGETDEN